MHYIGMAASFVALWCAYRLRTETIISAFWRKAGSAVIMGSGIYGMHYTAMVAARFAPDSVCDGKSNAQAVGTGIDYRP